MWWEYVLLGVAVSALVLAALLGYGKARWRAVSQSLHARLEATRQPPDPPTYDTDELAGLPDPVRRYFEAVLEPGQPVIAGVTVQHAGTFNTSEEGEQWAPFTSTQRVLTCRPGFDWEARIAMAPAVAVRVHDAYIAGEGILKASLFGLVSLVDMRGSPELAEGELMRYLAEAAWYPTALLPRQGVQWQPVDDRSAIATLEDGAAKVSLLFRFRDDGLIDSARAEARGRLVGERAIPTPWEGRWSAYRREGGMLVPGAGEVAWITAAGPKPYWRGRITRIEYHYAG